MNTASWLTETELSELTGVSTALLRRGVLTGLFDGLAALVDGEPRFAPDAAALVAWSDRLGDDVVAGRLSSDRAHRLLWGRARQIRQRLISQPQFA